MKKFNWVFIITFGRSGSTLLQGVINSIPGYEVKGENNFILLPLFRAAMRLKTTRYKFGYHETHPIDSWYGSHDVDLDGFSRQIVSAFVDTVVRPGGNAHVGGFKEIRYHELQENEIEEFMIFMTRYFNNPCFVYNERNIEDTSKSSFWNRVDDPQKSINRSLQHMKKMYELARDRSYWVNYDEYVKDPAQLEGLFSFLNEPFDLDQIQKVMNIKHSY